MARHESVTIGRYGCVVTQPCSSLMGYRELLKRYMRFVEAYAGETFVDVIPFAAEPPFEERDLAELRSVAGDIRRSTGDVADVERMPNLNYRLRQLLSGYGLTLEQAAKFAGVDAEKMHRWRSSPRSIRYLPIQATEFARFERALIEWIAGGSALPNNVRHSIQ